MKEYTVKLTAFEVGVISGIISKEMRIRKERGDITMLQKIDAKFMETSNVIFNERLEKAQEESEGKEQHGTECMSCGWVSNYNDITRPCARCAGPMKELIQ